MRIRTLDLLAFGPFTRHKLELGDRGRVSVVYGKNEAGKSTARRALLGLLYGIADNTPDAHLHAAADLAVGAVFVDEHGRAVRLVRRKKRKDSLRDAADAPVAESTLIELLGHVERALFSQLFCFGHEELEQGGQALLDGKGDAGQSLFDAGTGGSGIHRVLRDLEAEAEALYRPKGRNPKLNQALEAFRDASRELKNAIQLPEQWQTQKAALDEANAARAALEAERDALKRELTRLGRIQRALPIASRYADLSAQRHALGTVPRLPADAGDQRREALDSLRDAGRDLAECARRAAKRSEERAKLSIDDAVLEVGPTRIAEIVDALAISRNADADLPKLAGRLSAAETEALAVLERLGRAPSLDGTDVLRLGVADRQRIDELVPKGGELQGRLSELERRHAQTVEASELLEREIAAAPAPEDSEPLRRAIAKAQRAGDLDGRVRQLEEELAEIEPALALAVSRLAPWNGDVAVLAASALPSRDTVQRFEADERRLIDRKAELTAELASARRELGAIERAIAALEGMGVVPDERQLDEARRRRDAGWALVRRAWETAADVGAEARAFDPDHPLADAYARAVAGADELSDRLRREASRVAELAEKRKARQQSADTAAELQAKIDALGREHDALGTAWAELGKQLAIPPERPTALRDWLDRADRAVALWTRRTQIARQRAELVAQRSSLVASLVEPSMPSDASESQSLAEALDHAVEVRDATERAVRRHEARMRERAQLEAKARELGADRDALRAEWARWQADWARAIERLDLTADSSPSQVSAVLSELESLFDALERARGVRERIAGIERDQRAFAEKVRALVARHAPDLAGDQAADQAERLVVRFKLAERAAAERTRLDQELHTLGLDQERFEAQERHARARLDDLVAAAGVSDEAELASIEERVRRASELDAEIALAERELRQIAEQHGLGLEAVCSEATGIDGAELAARLEASTTALDEMGDQLGDAKQRIASLEAGLETYRAETGAEAAQRREAAAANVLEHAHQYARLKVAALVLRRQIERYREKNQDPIVTRASELLRELSVGSFRELRIGVEEKVLYCVRPDGKEVEVDGLSEGTRFQLYFALRLASLERHLEGGDALPLLLDDTFIHFDDERMSAAFRVLGQLAERTQVIYFTHHRHHLELARRALPKGALVEHDLGAPEGPGQLELLPELRAT